MQSIFVLTVCLLVSAISSNLYAQTNECPKDKLLIGSGLASGAYSQIVSTFASKCDMICEARDTQGGFDNIIKIINNQYDGGIVQADLLEFMSRNEPDVRGKVRSLISLHLNALHIIVPVEGVKVCEKGLIRETCNTVPIRGFETLRGKTVAAWSSAYITTSNVNHSLKLGMNVVEVKSIKEGMNMLSKGEAWAFMAMGGQPIEWIEGTTGVPSEVSKKFTLMRFDPQDLQLLGSNYSLTNLTYRERDAIGVTAIAVRNELVIKDIQKGNGVKSVANFKQCFEKNLEEIKSTRGTHRVFQNIELGTPLSWIPYQAPK